MTAATTDTRDDPSPGAVAEVRRPWLALSSLLIGLSMIIIDGSVVNVLLPDMVDDLGLTQTEAQWVNSIYSLIFAALLITIGLLADRFGRRLMFLSGTVVFLVGSLLAGSATSPAFLIASRAVQAVGAAMMMPSSIAVINVLFTGRRRAVAFGLWGAVFGGAAALGPLLGGFLAEYWSWRLAFLINIPVGIVAAVMVLKTVPETKVAGIARLDVVGVLLSACGLGLIVYALIEGQDFGWWQSIAQFDLGPVSFEPGGLSVVPVALLAGVVLLFLLVLWEARRTRLGQGALVDLSLFTIRRYGFGNVVALIVSLGEFGILFVLPLWMQSVHGTDPLETGAILAFLAVGTLASGGAARPMSERLGATRVVRLGMALEIAGILGIAFTVSPTRDPWWLVVALIVYGLGLGFASAQLTNVVLADVPPAKSGQASAMTSTFRQVGSALGAAVLGAVLFSGLGIILSHELARDGTLPQAQQEQVVDEIQTSAGQAIVGLEKVPGMESVVSAAKVAYTKAARDTAFCAALFVLLGLMVSFGLPRDADDPQLEARRAEEPEPEPEPEPAPA